MFGYYILQGQNPAYLERQRLRNAARAEAFSAAIRRLRARGVHSASDGLALLYRRIRTSLLSVLRPPVISERKRRYTR